jgi:hypothetical protein
MKALARLMPFLPGPITPIRITSLADLPKAYKLGAMDTAAIPAADLLKKFLRVMFIFDNFQVMYLFYFYFAINDKDSKVFFYCKF